MVHEWCYNYENGRGKKEGSLSVFYSMPNLHPPHQHKPQLYNNKNKYLFIDQPSLRDCVYLTLDATLSVLAKRKQDFNCSISLHLTLGYQWDNWSKRHFRG